MSVADSKIVDFSVIKEPLYKYCVEVLASARLDNHFYGQAQVAFKVGEIMGFDFKEVDIQAEIKEYERLAGE